MNWRQCCEQIDIGSDLDATPDGTTQQRPRASSGQHCRLLAQIAAVLRSEVVALEAEDALQLIVDEIDRTRRTSEVAVALAASGKADRAIEMASSLPSGFARDDALLAVALALASIDSEAGLIAARLIGDKSRCAVALAGVATAQVSVETANEALEVAMSLPAEWSSELMLVGFAAALASIDGPRAIRLARAAPVGIRRAQRLAEVAAVLGSADLAEEATGCFASLSDAQQLHAAGVAVALAGVDPGAAITIARGISLIRERDDALAVAVAALVPIDRARAVLVARESHSKVLADVAIAVAAHDPGDALDIASSLPLGRWRARALAGIAAVAALPDVADEALAIALCIDDDPTWRALSLADVSVSASTAVRTAVDAAKAITEDVFGIASLTEVATTLARVDVTAAMEVANLLTDDISRGRAVVNIVGAVDDPQLGIDLSRTITEPSLRARALASVAIGARFQTSRIVEWLADRWAPDETAASGNWRRGI